MPSGTRRVVAAWVALAAAGACSPGEPHDDPAVVPPVFGADVLQPWLAAGVYKAGGWTCEAAPHATSGLSPHGTIRTCTNPVALAAAAAADWPVDSAWVTELYAGSGALRGFTVMRRSEPTAGSASWYWFQEADSAAPSADGWGFEGAPLTDCSACHVLAGTGSNRGHGFVF